MTFLSLFSGCGGFDLGLERAGLRCVGQVEIDPYCRAVLSKHWPDVSKWGDVRTFDGKRLERPDVIAGGFPCQDLSVAGQRDGLAGDRSGLFYEMVRVIREVKPAYVIWENVAGLGSSDGGRDFLRVLSELARAGYFGAVRRLDAQRYGVPQQRRRYFGLFARGRSGAERCSEILAVAQSMRRHPAEGGKAGPRVARSITAGAHPGGFNGQDVGQLIYGGNDTTGPRTVAAGQLAVCVTGDRTHSLRSEGGDASEDGTGRGTPIIAFAQNQRNEVRELTAAGALSAEPGMKQQTYLHTAGTVRRLTPRECERLMSWPDDWTRWKADGTEIKDGPRYRMIGNGVVANVAEWIGRRLMETDRAE